MKHYLYFPKQHLPQMVVGICMMLFITWLVSPSLTQECQTVNNGQTICIGEILQTILFGGWIIYLGSIIIDVILYNKLKNLETKV